jgi:hypothetical protein
MKLITADSRRIKKAKESKIRNERFKRLLVQCQKRPHPQRKLLMRM